MTENERLDILINTLIEESHRYRNVSLPDSIEEKRNMLRALMNVRPPEAISQEFLRLQDEELQTQLSEKGVMEFDEHINGRRYIVWQGDITRLKVDAIVNAANSQMLGCFVPLHRCIDNAIHSAAGVQLRLECEEIMHRKGHEEDTGKSIITSGYNLQAKHVIHTVGPIVYGAYPTELDEELLASCYRSCLECAEANTVTSIAFCCISTGEFRFPNEEAAEIAVETVERYFKENPNSTIKTVVFNVFKDIDYSIYSDLLKGNDYANIR